MKKDFYYLSVVIVSITTEYNLSLSVVKKLALLENVYSPGLLPQRNALQPAFTDYSCSSLPWYWNILLLVRYTPYDQKIMSMLKNPGVAL